MKIDLHCHSEASADCVTPLPRILARLRATGIAVQAITDHDQVWGAQELWQIAREETEAGAPTPTIIVGEEVSTREGEIVGLFLDERIEPRLSPEDTVEAIKAQGGLVMIPHGFDPLKRYRLRPEALLRIANDVDIIEIFNARVSRPSWNQAAEVWADERRIAKSAGTDAHTLADIGTAWVEAPHRDIEGPKDLLAALRHGAVQGNWKHPLLAFGYKMGDWLVQSLKKRFAG